MDLDFTVELESTPAGVYCPGQLVRGIVLVSNNKELNFYGK